MASYREYAYSRFQNSLILQMENKKRVKLPAEKESDRLRSQRYRDEHSTDPEYQAKRANKARENRAAAGPLIYSPATKARKAANLVAWRKRKREETCAAASTNAVSGRKSGILLGQQRDPAKLATPKRRCPMTAMCDSGPVTSTMVIYMLL